MTHNRVTPQGQALGESSARLANLGRLHLEAIGLADVKAPSLRDGMCKTCACQRGSVPNGCLQTQLDFLKCVIEGKPFLCHAPMDGRICAGWIRGRAALAKAPPPPELVALVAKWEYSPDNSAADQEGKA